MSPDGATSQVAKPPTRITIAVTTSHVRTPDSNTAQPSAMNGGGVRDEVPPAGVQERREQHAPETSHLARTDAESVQLEGARDGR